MMNLFHNADYIFNSDYAFTDRFDPRTEGYFSGQGELTGRFFLTTNFVPDTHTLKLTDYSERGKGSTNMKFRVPGRDLQERASAWSGRSRDYFERPGLFDSMAGG
jgi:hypothetical protein